MFILFYTSHIGFNLQFSGRVHFRFSSDEDLVVAPLVNPPNTDEAHLRAPTPSLATTMLPRSAVWAHTRASRSIPIRTKS